MMLPSRRSRKVFYFTFFLCDFPRSAHFNSKDDGNRTDQKSHNIDPTSKIWDMYLSREYERAKERSKRWSASADGVIVFVRNKLCHKIVLFSLETVIRPVFSPWCWLHSSSSAFRSYCKIRPISPISFSARSPSSYRQMGLALHSRCLFPTILHSIPPIMPCP